jgi:Ca2+-binding RTX toxin-like protein
MKKMKKRAIVLLTTMAAVMVLGSGVALAATTIHCPNNSAGGTPSTYLYCNGTSLADTMDGSDLIDYMLGNGGNDTMHGYGGNDYYLEGGNGSDHLYGDAGGDEDLWGGAYSGGAYNDTSDDYVYGGSGADHIYGGYAQGGVDRLYGQGANDLIEASYRKDPNGVSLTKEIIDCGAGANDEVFFDKGVDVVTNCEIKHAYS